MNAFVKVGLRNNGLFTLFGHKLTTNRLLLDQMNAQDVSNILNALARFDFKNFIKAVGDHIVKDPLFVRQFNDTDISVALHFLPKSRYSLVALTVEEIMKRPNFFSGKRSYLDYNQILTSIEVIDIKNEKLRKMMKEQSRL